jgi:hypothetical protein
MSGTSPQERQKFVLSFLNLGGHNAREESKQASQACSATGHVLLPVVCRAFFYYVAHFLAAVASSPQLGIGTLFGFGVGWSHGLVLGFFGTQCDLLVMRADECSRPYLASVDFHYWYRRGIVLSLPLSTKTKMIKKPLPRHHIGSFVISTTSVDEASTGILARLGTQYCLLQPEKTFDDFATEVLIPLAASSPDRPANIEFNYSRAHSKQTYAALMRFLTTACVQSIEADKADERADQAQAWRHIANAMYSLGLLEGSVIIEPALEHIISSRSAKGASVRNNKLEPLREHARKLAAERPFKSRRQAALGIKDAVLQKAKSDGIALSEMQAEHTITSWLKNMPFGSQRKP